MNEDDQHNDDEVISEELQDEIRRRAEGGQSVLAETMIQLVKSGHADFLFLRDDSCKKWWDNTVSNARESIVKRNNQIKIYLLKKSAWDKLSKEERKLLCLQAPSINKWMLKYIPQQEESDSTQP